MHIIVSEVRGLICLGFIEKMLKRLQSPSSLNVYDQFINLLMKDGKKAKAAALLDDVFLILKKSFPNESPQDLLGKAVARASPLLKLVSQKKGSKSIQIPTPLDLKQQRRFGILWIIKGAQKRITRQNSRYLFGDKLALEILGVLKGTNTFAIDKKREVYTLALQNKTNVVMNSNAKRK
jgi:small subunit ribosomal protein S7